MNDIKIQLSIIIVNFNTERLIVKCIQSIYQYPPSVHFEIIVIDNGSTDQSIEKIKYSFSDVKLIENKINLGFSKANNQGIKLAKGEILLLLNSDTKVLDGTLNKLVKFIEKHPEINSVAPKLLNEDGTPQRSIFNFPSAFKIFLHITELSKIFERIIYTPYFNSILSKIKKLKIYKIESLKNDEYIKVEYVCFACIAFKKKLFEKIGLLDEKIYFYHEDCEFSYRLIKNGQSIWFLPSSKVIHLGSGSSQSVSEMAYQNYYRSLIYLFRKHLPSQEIKKLKIIYFAGFTLRAILTLFGCYRTLKIPSTHKKIDNTSPKSFGTIYKRFKYYKYLALLPYSRERGSMDSYIIQ